MISRYLESLSAELRVPPRTRARILAETRDHLHESLAEGRSEREAVEAFGEPRELAARFHEQLASASARRASARTAALMAVFLVACAAAFLGPANDLPFGLIVFFGAQLSAVAAGIGLVRWARYRDAAQVPVARLPDLYRANGLAVACVALVSGAELVDAAGGGGNANLALAVGAGVLLAGSIGVGWSLARSVSRARVVEVTAGGPVEDAFDDLRAAAGLIPGADHLLHVVQSTLRRHPWRVCLVFAAACGVALAAQHAIADGGGSLHVSHVGRALLAGLAIASIEAAAVVACFAAFGRFLGIRR